MNKILVTGASGHLGKGVVLNLLKTISANEIIILARDASKVKDLTKMGIETRIGDYQIPETLTTAFEGINKLLLVSSSDFKNRLGQHQNVLNAAKKSGVSHVFYTGVNMHDIEQSPIKPLLYDHFQTEEYIKELGFTYTFLRNSLYAEVIPRFIGENVLETGIYFPAGDGKVSFSLRKDLAEAAAVIIAGEGHENKIYGLNSSKEYSFQDIATILSGLSGKKIQYNSPENNAYEALLKQIGLPEGIIFMSTLFAAGIKNNDFNKSDGTLENLIGRESSDIKNYLKEAYNL
jgi:NAD(P)H dehydrogenase (quinone)